MWEYLLSDPTLPVEHDVLEILVRDKKRWTRRYLLPSARLIARVSAALIVTLKRILPFQFSSHWAIDRLNIWFIRRFVSPDAAYFLIRHFIIETNLLNFIGDNSDADVPRIDLLPTNIDELADNVVILHDIHLYNFLIDLGQAPNQPVVRRRPLEEIDWKSLDLPTIDTSSKKRHWMNLDLQTSLVLMNVPFSLLTTEDEYERAINSFQLDEAIMACLADITGDDAFRSWRPVGPTLWTSIARDVSTELYWHAIIDEYAYTRLTRMRDSLS